MATADKSIDPRILESAKREFLQKGFLNASLKDICRDAGVTTGRCISASRAKRSCSLPWCKGRRMSSSAR